MKQEDITRQKKNVRREIKELKKIISAEKIILDSENIFIQVEALPQFKTAKIVLAYWSLPDEVGTHNFIIKWAVEKKMVLPIVVGDSLELRVFKNRNSLVESSAFGIQEPQAGELVNPIDVDFAVIPGIAFDRKGNRLGRGKGFYDRILNRTRAYRVAVGFDFQILEKVPVSSFDVPVDIVISSKKQTK